MTTRATIWGDVDNGIHAVLFTPSTLAPNVTSDRLSLIKKAHDIVANSPRISRRVTVFAPDLCKWARLTSGTSGHPAISPHVFFDPCLVAAVAARMDVWIKAEIVDAEGLRAIRFADENNIGLVMAFRNKAEYPIAMPVRE